jgi:hypothetical protein
MIKLLLGIALIIVGFIVAALMGFSNIESRFLLFFQLLLFVVLVLGGVITCFMAAVSLGA